MKSAIASKQATPKKRQLLPKPLAHQFIGAAKKKAPLPGPKKENLRDLTLAVSLIVAVLAAALLAAATLLTTLAGLLVRLLTLLVVLLAALLLTALAALLVLLIGHQLLLGFDAKG